MITTSQTNKHKSQKKFQKYWEHTFIPKPTKERKWFLCDLKKKETTIGRVINSIISFLRGKNRSDFTYNLDNGNYIVILNANSNCIKLKGKNKKKQKCYYNYSGYIGNLKKRDTKEMLEKYPKELIFRIIKGMLPHNKLSKKQMKRVFVFHDEKHNLQAQEKNFIEL